MKRILFVLLGMLLLLSGCKNDKVAVVKVNTDADSVPDTTETAGAASEQELMEDQQMPQSAEKLFDDFFYNFASNKRVQLERIVFPLKVNSGYKVEEIARQDWQMERFFMDDNVYTLIFDNEEQMERMKDLAVSEAIVERFYLEKDFVRQYLFGRRDGRWMLYEIRNQTLPRNPNASFIAFYHKFATDPDFQRASLNAEIEYSGPEPDDDSESDDDYEEYSEPEEDESLDGFITPDLWEDFAPELPKGTLYNVVYGPQNADAKQKIMLIRGVANGFMEELVFEQKGSKWKLMKLSR